jgi:site-specific recombinase XerD
MKHALNFPALLQAFFTDRLIAQRNASPNTIAAYRDSFRLLFDYAREQLGKAPSALTLEDLNSSFIGSFLNHLEQDRGNSARSRNARLAAIHSFFRYVAYQLPEQSSSVQRVLAIPGKKHERALVEYLTEDETSALLDAPDRNTFAGRRDYALMLVGIQTGLRVSELTGLCCRDVMFGTGAHVCCVGKGRKARCTPLTQSVAIVVKAWIKERHPQPEDPLFPNRRGAQLSTDGVQFILTKHVAVARQQCASLKGKKISPHVLRHTAAMNLLHAGADTATIALWLGHERLDTVNIYVAADLAAKEKILAKTATPEGKTSRFRPDDALLAFLKSL